MIERFRRNTQKSNKRKEFRERPVSRHPDVKIGDELLVWNYCDPVDQGDHVIHDGYGRVERKERCAKVLGLLMHFSLQELRLSRWYLANTFSQTGRIRNSQCHNCLNLFITFSASPHKWVQRLLYGFRTLWTRHAKTFTHKDRECTWCRIIGETLYITTSLSRKTNYKKTCIIFKLYRASVLVASYQMESAASTKRFNNSCIAIFLPEIPESESSCSRQVFHVWL